MNAREERGLVIAAVCKLNKTQDGWLVPSQSAGDTIYTVDPYNLAQSIEKDRLQELLFDLCKTLAEPERPVTRGQKPHTLKDSIFATVFKVYSTFSSRRFSSDFAKRMLAAICRKRFLASRRRRSWRIRRSRRS